MDNQRDQKHVSKRSSSGSESFTIIPIYTFSLVALETYRVLATDREGNHLIHHRQNTSLLDGKLLLHDIQAAYTQGAVMNKKFWEPYEQDTL